MIEIVCATRLSSKAFTNTAPLGLSITRLAGDARLSAHVTYRNTRGLPEIYNARILDASGGDVLLFVHDDVWLDDPALADAVLEGLSTYDVVGVAGSRRSVPGHVSWAFVDDGFTWDAAENLSGAVAHGSQSHGVISRYGGAPAECELLDGVLLAARRRTLERHRVLFDTAFDFHFYDLDFCRTARRAGLRLATWPIAITHASGGSFGSRPWKRSLARYRRKWDPAGPAL